MPSHSISCLKGSQSHPSSSVSLFGIVFSFKYSCQWVAQEWSHDIILANELWMEACWGGGRGEFLGKGSPVPWEETLHRKGSLLFFYILSQEMTGAILSVAPWRDAEKWEMDRFYLTHTDITELLNQPTKAHITSSLPVVKVSSFLKPAWIQVLIFFFFFCKWKLR